MSRSVHFTPGGEIRITAKNEGTVILHPTSPLGLAITNAVAEALDALDREIEPSDGPVTLVDGDSYLWVYVNGYWHCAINLDDEDDELFLPPEGPSRSIYKGFESWTEVASHHGLTSTETTYSFVDGDGDTWVFAAPYWYCVGGGDDGAEIDTHPEATMWPTGWEGLDSWVDAAGTYGIRA